VWTSLGAGVAWLILAGIIQSGLISLEKPVGDLTPEVFTQDSATPATK
jgi:hypothetical protein